MRDVSVFEKKQVMGAFVFLSETKAQGLDPPAVASQGCLYNGGVDNIGIPKNVCHVEISCWNYVYVSFTSESPKTKYLHSCSQKYRP